MSDERTIIAIDQGTTSSRAILFDENGTILAQAVAELPQILSDFDEVILLDIYPARELPISGVTSDSISKKMTLNNVMTVSKPELPFLIHNSQANVVVIMGAGDIAMEVNPIVEYLKKSTNVA